MGTRVVLRLPVVVFFVRESIELTPITGILAMEMSLSLHVCVFVTRLLRRRVKAIVQRFRLSCHRFLLVITL